MVQKSQSVVLLIFPPLSKIVACSRDGAADCVSAVLTLLLL